MYSQCISPIDYNEKKVAEGRAKIIENKTFGTNAEEFKEILNDTAELNSKVSKNKFFQIPLSATENDKLSNEEFKDFANDYMEEMGYSNCPYLIYRHYDTENSHIHIVGSTIDFDGKKVKESELVVGKMGVELKGNYQKSVEVLKKLETKYNLTIVMGANKGNKNLDELNTEKYRCQKGILTAMKIPALVSKLEKIQGFEKVVSSLNDKDLSNYQIKQKIGGTKAYDELIKFLERENCIKQSKKEQLKSKLTHLIVHTSSLEELSKKLESNNMYVKKIFNGDKHHLVFGDKSTGLYVKDSQIGERFKFENLFKEESTIKPIRSENIQKSFLKKEVSKAVIGSKTLEDFAINLRSRGIELIIAENKGGIYGMSFKSNKVENPTVFKGSDLDRSLGYQNIKTNLSINLDHQKTKIELKKVIVETKTKSEVQTTKGPNIGKLKKAFDEGEDEKISKNKNEQSF